MVSSELWASCENVGIIAIESYAGARERVHLRVVVMRGTLISAIPFSFLVSFALRK